MLLFAVVETVTSQPPQTGPATAPVAPGAMQTGNYGYPADIEQSKPPCDWTEIAQASGTMSVAGAAIGSKVDAKYGTIIGGVAGGVAGAAGAYYDCV
jgi:uncharacterized membrane protein